MKIINTFIKLRLKEGKKYDCGFCGNFFHKIEATHLLRISDLDINKTVDIDYTCDNCKERIESKQLGNCADCGRLKKKLANKCLCVYLKENNLTSGAISNDSDDEYSPLELERQINTLSEEKEQLMEEVLKVSEDWHKRQKQELLDETKRLKEEIEKLKEENRKLALQELAKEELEQVNQLAQIETPAKENKIKNLFKFGSK